MMSQANHVRRKQDRLRYSPVSAIVRPETTTTPTKDGSHRTLLTYGWKPYLIRIYGNGGMSGSVEEVLLCRFGVASSTHSDNNRDSAMAERSRNWRRIPQFPTHSPTAIIILFLHM
jgi:hypothetical protein